MPYEKTLYANNLIKSKSTSLPHYMAVASSWAGRVLAQANLHMHTLNTREGIAAHMK